MQHITCFNGRGYRKDINTILETDKNNQACTMLEHAKMHKAINCKYFYFCNSDSLKVNAAILRSKHLEVTCMDSSWNVVLVIFEVAWGP